MPRKSGASKRSSRSGHAIKKSHPSGPGGMELRHPSLHSSPEAPAPPSPMPDYCNEGHSGHTAAGMAAGWTSYSNSGPRGWWFWPAGILGPLAGSLIGLALLAGFMIVLQFSNVLFQSAFIGLMTAAVLRNLQWFFVVSLFMGYSRYFIQFSKLAYWTLWPAANGIGITFSAWILAWVVRVFGTYAGMDFLVSMGNGVRANLPQIFLIFLFASYFSLGMQMMLASRKGEGQRGY